MRFDKFIGGAETVYEWDQEKDISAGFRDVMGFLYQRLPGLRAQGAEMWPMEPATVYFRWSSGLLRPNGALIVVSYDASEKGWPPPSVRSWAIILRLEGMYFEGVSTIITFEDTPEAQVHREAAGAPMVIRLLRRLFDLRGKTVMIRNDCAPVIFALRKGSSSRQLQEAAEIVSRESLEAGCRTLALHVPGVQLIAEGIDGGSREGAERLRGPACTAWARRVLRDFLRSHGWRITLDLFAAGSNAFVERYISWADEPGSEVVDAFDLRSWAQSRCVCGQFHRETLFIFPPRGLERAVVRRAKSDNVRGCFVVPTNHKAGYWKLLRSSAVAHMAFDKPDEAFEFAQAPLSAHSVFLVDFGGADEASPCCGQEHIRRGRQARWEPHEEEELAALRRAADTL